MSHRDALGPTAGVATPTGLGFSYAELLVAWNETEEEDPGPTLPGYARPRGSLEAALPDGGDYELADEVYSSEGVAADEVRRSVIGTYRGPDGYQYTAGITEYASEAAARAGPASQPDEDDALGWARTGEFVYFAMGPAEDAVAELLAAAPRLNPECVAATITFA